MKIAQEIRAGNVIMHGKDPMVVLKAEYARGGRNAATVRMKLKSLLNNFGTEVVFKADDKMEQIVLDKKECTYSYFADPMYVCMDSEYNQYEVEAENMGDALNYLEDGMSLEVVFYEGKAISVELPTSVEREITWTEPAVKGDTSGKVMKPAKISTGFEVACRYSWPRATRSKSTPAPANTASASEQQQPQPPRQAAGRRLGHAAGAFGQGAAARPRPVAAGVRRPRVPAAARDARAAHAARADEARPGDASARHREHGGGVRQRALSQRRGTRRIDRAGRRSRRRHCQRTLAPAGARQLLLRAGARLRQAGGAIQQRQGAGGQAVRLHRRRSGHHAGGQPRRPRGRRTVGRPGNRTADGRGSQPLRHACAELQASTTSPSARCIS